VSVIHRLLYKLGSDFGKCIGKLNYDKGDNENLRKSLDRDWAQLFDSFDNDVNKMWDCLKNFLNFNIHKHIPIVSNFCEWKKPVWKCPLDEKIRSLI